MRNDHVSKEHCELKDVYLHTSYKNSDYGLQHKEYFDDQHQNYLKAQVQGNVAIRKFGQSHSVALLRQTEQFTRGGLKQTELMNKAHALGLQGVIKQTELTLDRFLNHDQSMS